MSKLSPLGQSMASLFTPESERLRTSAAQADGTGRAPPGSARIPGMKDIKGHKSGDSLGNPNSPGYEPWGKKERKGEKPSEQATETKGPAGTVIEPPVQGPELIRLALGWETILLAQKKLCEKAKALFTRLEGPEKYHSQKKGRLLLIKSRGCIVDLDLQQTQDQKEAQAKGKETA